MNTAFYAPIRVEHAAASDAFRAGMIHALSYRQKRSLRRENAIDITMVRNHAHEAAVYYCQCMEDTDALNFIARVPEFDTPFPLEKHDGYQDAGWAEIYTKPDKTLRIGWLYTVTSPYRVGSALLHAVIEQAGDMGMTRITTLAAYAASAQWFHERGLFGPYHPDKTGGQEMHLDRARFAAAQRALRR